MQVAAFTIVNGVLTCKDNVTDNRNKIGKTLAEALKTYRMPAALGESIANEQDLNKQSTHESAGRKQEKVGIALQEIQT